jgi:UDP-2-acetamido-2,6-beta-L-arabino-hexul-4-ose reductase
MKKIGITGSNGFVGTHLTNYLNLQPDITLVPFERQFFDDPELMQRFVQSCDTIVHLAGLNRHADVKVILETNIALSQKLIEACTATDAKPHILFSSSTQEDRENDYGLSKKTAREALEAWASQSGAVVTGLVIPNVFGPFGHPYYNSVVATFCHKIARDEEPQIQVDSEVQLIYVNQLVAEIWHDINQPRQGRVDIPHQFTIKVSDLLQKLLSYKALYLEKGEFPALDKPFDLALFNTFRCYIPDEKYPFPLKVNTDQRGNFVEIARTGSSGQFSYSTTKPGITRGNHFHTRKAERFAVILGKAKISLRRMGTDQVIDYIIDGETPGFVDMPIWHTHNITNIGDTELLTLFWINEPYNPDDPDTYFVNV